jgi:protocatechuate 3,4-dioxygenase beta subunit
MMTTLRCVPWAANRLRSILLIAVTIVTGQIVDRTTGQPLTGVDVGVAGGPKVAPARTNDAGKYTLHGVAPGKYTLTLSSDDVPPQTFTLVVKAAKTQQFNLTACSTTLDYSCAAAQP